MQWGEVECQPPHTACPDDQCHSLHTIQPCTSVQFVAPSMGHETASRTQAGYEPQYQRQKEIYLIYYFTDKKK